MGRWLVILGLTIVCVGFLWPWLQRIGLGRLPGDIVIERGGFRFYFPLMTSLLLSLIFSFLVWFFKR
ncbi:MAG: DUF2905 domain-containing protein [Pseudomonadota bacterium]